MTEHTPGPWKAVASDPSSGVDCWWILDSDGLDIGTACGYQEDPRSVADARLIAAAPVMFDYIRAKAEEGDERAKEIMRSLS